MALDINQVLQTSDSETRTDNLRVSPTSLKVDQWGLRKGVELYEETQERFYGGDEKHRQQFDSDASAALTPEEWADCHAALFESRPKLADRPANQHQADWFQSLLDTDGYKALHKQTRGNLLLAKESAKEIGEELAKFLELDAEETDAVDAAGSVAKAIRRGKRAADDAAATIRALGGGCGVGQGYGAELDSELMAGVFERVRNDETLRAIMDSAGKFRRVAQSMQRRKTVHGVDDVVGVTIGGDIPELCLHELAALVNEETELLQLYKIATETAMQRDYQGVEPVGKGPIVVVVDESSSMSKTKKPQAGDRIVQAKGLALAMAWIAQKQNRWIAFVGFAGGNQGNTLAMAPGQWDQVALLNWLEHFYAGGTTLDVPIRELPYTHWPQWKFQGMPDGKCDLIVVTDGELRCSDAEAERFREWKQRESVVSFGIVIGASISEFSKICDQLFCVADLSVESEGVGEVFSV
ncbi:hypothetical protein KOR42_23260 [Thalassoglobus neptunius]|uniref:VWFA domain-containing protein n=1 Tax=Thalassoglobus neptunius TaxID=1938619 RepID=A0A5C5X898_9PLAN|nr:hypothetical protein [Thalassoglobus neptunius]TWT58939.1 hypothetical protein KOR42_23260 [Thalassoglobus neptunius]